MADQRARRLHTDIVIGTAGAVVLVGLLLLARDAGAPELGSPARVARVTLLSAVFVGWTGYWVLRVLRAIDEYKLHVEQASWFWGGLVGLLVSVPVYSFVMSGGLHWLNPSSPVRPDLGRAFASGYMLPLFMQTLGALVVALWMRFSKR